MEPYDQRINISAEVAIDTRSLGKNDTTRLHKKIEQGQIIVFAHS